MAQVEPLPLVPATVITGQLNFKPSRWATVRTRSSPISMPLMPLGCRRSQWASQSAREETAVGGVGVRRRFHTAQDCRPLRQYPHDYPVRHTQL